MLNKILVDLYKLEENWKRVKKYHEERRTELSEKIKAYMAENDTDVVEVEHTDPNDFIPMKIKGKLVKQSKIIWDCDKLESQLGKEICKEFIDKTYTINDIDGLIKYLKSCGVSPKKFKSFLNISKSVNVRKLDQLSDLGDIEDSDLEGCYEVKENDGYIKVSMKEMEI